MSNQTQFIGRGERRVRYILEKLFGTTLFPQLPLSYILPAEEIDQMGPDYKNHKYDLGLLHLLLLFETNYKHKKRAEQKQGILQSHIEAHGWTLVTIEDWNCPHLFQEPHHNTWDDYLEVIQELKRNKINERGEKINDN